MKLLDGPLAEADATERLEAVAATAARSLDVVSWTISVAEPEGGALRAVLVGMHRAEGDSGTESFVFDDAAGYMVADYPLTGLGLPRGIGVRGGR